MVLLHLALFVPGSAQVNTASLTGIVTDSQGANVANVAVTVTNKATSSHKRATTDVWGYYNFASLPVGAYTMQVEIQGLKRAVQENVNLEVGQKARIDFTLEVGAVTETVSVVTAPPILSTQEPSPGGVVESRMIPLTYL